MRKILFLAIAISFCKLALALTPADVIITTDSKKIDAKIIEVSKSDIKYKEVDYLEGPTYVLSISDISSIIFANGKVVAYTQQNNNTPAEKPKNTYATNQGELTFTGEYYVYNGQNISKKELPYFLQKECPTAYETYLRWDTCEKTGWSFLAMGPVICLPLGLSLYACCARLSYSSYTGRVYTRTNEDMLYSGIAFMAIGAGLTVISMPLISTGINRKKNIPEIFNTMCTTKSQTNMQLHLNVNSNGLGLALNF